MALAVLGQWPQPYPPFLRVPAIRNHKPKPHPVLFDSALHQPPIDVPTLVDTQTRTHNPAWSSVNTPFDGCISVTVLLFEFDSSDFSGRLDCQIASASVDPVAIAGQGVIATRAEVLRRVSFHNNDHHKYRRRTLSEMAELDGGLPAGIGARPGPAKAKSESASTDSENLVLTPEMSSTSTAPSGTPSTVGSPHLVPVSTDDDDEHEHAIAETPILGATTVSRGGCGSGGNGGNGGHGGHGGSGESGPGGERKSPGLGPSVTIQTTATTIGGGSTSRGPSSRHASFSGSSSYQEDWDIPPLDRLTVLDLLDNFALPQQLEKLSKGISAQTRKLRRSRDALKSRSQGARERMVEEWRQRVPSAEEQLERYRRRMRTSVEKLGRQWNDTRVITMREKVAFICGVLNIFISGYLMGGWPEWMPLWYTVQILYFMPIRFYTYHRRGYHYFLADLCYFVNFLLLLSIWAFPTSRRLFVATYCLAFGNNAVAIVMWRNSLVFHSFDKVTSLFIHVMPCATLHCMVHLLDPAQQAQRFPAIYVLRHTPPGAPGAYANIVSMLAWSTIPYAVWQLSYYFFITVRRRDKIAAGRPTSFTWLRHSYSKVWIGRLVLGLPMALQEPAFMLIQYLYAVLTMLPCPVWFYHRSASAVFLFGVFTWSIYNGATYYIDVFGKRFQKELEAMKLEVAKWHIATESGLLVPDGSTTPGGDAATPAGAASASPNTSTANTPALLHSNAASPPLAAHTAESSSIDEIPLLDGNGESDGGSESDYRDPGAASAAAALAEATVTGVDWDEGAKDVAHRNPY